MRIWVGLEKEGADTGNKTLFVEASSIDSTQVLVIRQLASENEVSAIYFGAGKVELLRFSRDISLLNDFYTIIETAIVEKMQVYGKIFHNVIVRFDIKDIKTNVTFKLDNGKFVAVTTDYALTNIREVRDGMYNGDKLVYYE